MKHLVYVDATVIQITKLLVEADSENEAKKRALDVIEKDPANIKWRYGQTLSMSPYIMNGVPFSGDIRVVERDE